MIVETDSKTAQPGGALSEHPHGRQRALAFLLVAIATAFLSALPSAADEDLGGETEWRWIGLRPANAASCPRPRPAAGWTTGPLFENSQNVELRRFCLYRRSESGDSSALLSLPLDDIDRDVMGVSAQDSTLARETWELLEDYFHSQAGLVKLPAGAPSRVRLTIADTSPNGVAAGASGPEDAAANSPHGKALLNMARDLVCAPNELVCRAKVASRLAMGWVCFQASAPGPCRDSLLGGYVGLIGELAQAIHREVSDSSPQGRLVLNLSLGWNQALGGDAPQVSDMSTPVQAVYRALEDAVCRGALPIAAAGNRDASVVQESGPFLPALWETRRAPSSSQCQQLGVTPAAGLDGPSAYRPLVFSVAGLEGSAEPLDMTRRNGKPPLAAFADHATVALSGGGSPSGTLTGTSVAALVVSATAAVVWSYWPQADAFQVMNLLYESGDSLAAAPDYCLGAGGCAGNWIETRRVDLCEAVASVCNQVGCAVPVCPAPAALEIGDADLSAFESVHQLDMIQLDDHLAGQPACTGETVFYDNTRPAPQFACPHRQLDGPTLSPWTEPQPPSVPCPNCMGIFSSPGTLYFEVDDEWQGALSSATLRCGANSYALGLGTLSSGDRVRLTNVPAECLTAFPTFLSFAHVSGNAVLSPLLVCEGCQEEAGAVTPAAEGARKKPERRKPKRRRPQGSGTR